MLCNGQPRHRHHLAKIKFKVVIGSLTANGACDGIPTCDELAAGDENIVMVISPPVTALVSEDTEFNPSQRDQHIVRTRRPCPRAPTTEITSTTSCSKPPPPLLAASQCSFEG